MLILSTPRCVAFVGVCLAIAWPGVAAADDVRADDDASHERPQVFAAKGTGNHWSTRRELGFGVRHGVFVDGHSGGVGVGADLTHRRGLLVVGAVGDFGAALLTSYTYWGGGAALGISAPSPSWLHVDLLGVAGAHAYANVGDSGIFGGAAASLGVLTDRGSSAVLPFAGARLRTSFELGGRNRFAIGLEGIAETDLTRVTRAYETTAIGIGYRDVTVGRRTIGTERLAGAITLGGTFDL